RFQCGNAGPPDTQPSPTRRSSDLSYPAPRTWCCTVASVPNPIAAASTTYRSLSVRVVTRNTAPERRRRSTRITSPATVRTAANRSEEHTSELQSRENLVCRLLLEK